MSEHKIKILELKQFTSYLTPRSQDANKGQFGHVLIVGGDYGYGGAVHLAAEAALRVGAGLVSVATRAEHIIALNAARPEIMAHAVKSATELTPLLEKASVIVVGPGMGRSEWARILLHCILKSKKPLIIDADGLNILSEHPIQKDNWILTPHPGEAARLLKLTIEDVQQDRLGSIKILQQKFDGICILKGAGSLIIGPDHMPSICELGNPGMATAGMGDILSGIIAGLLAQKMPSFIAAELGVVIHAMAGDLAAINGQRGMIASDLMIYLRQLVNP